MGTCSHTISDFGVTGFRVFRPHRVKGLRFRSLRPWDCVVEFKVFRVLFFLVGFGAAGARGLVLKEAPPSCIGPLIRRGHPASGRLDPP